MLLPKEAAFGPPMLPKIQFHEIFLKKTRETEEERDLE
jgi:hypothetical protein